MPEGVGEGLVLTSDTNGVGSRQSAAAISERDPTVLDSVKDGVNWGEISDIPAGFADGVDDVDFDDLKEFSGYWLVCCPAGWQLK
jgi:hypothetical protein